MARDITDIVVDTRRRLDRTSSRFVAIDPNQQRGLFFGTQTVETSVSTELQKRPSGTTDPWQDATPAKRSGVVTVDGHELTAASLYGAGSTPDVIAYGDDTTAADKFDTALGNQLGTLNIASTSTPGSDAVCTSASTTSNSFVTSLYEVGVKDGDADLVSREVFDGASSVDPSNDEIRFVTTITFTVDAFGQGLFTDAGAENVPEAVVDSSFDLFMAFVFSDQDDDLKKSQTSLPNETFRNSVTEDRTSADVIVTSRVTTDDTASGYPYDIVQAGVVTDNDVLIWASDNRALTVESDTEFTAEIRFVVSN
jgi:hypothetical protein